MTAYLCGNPKTDEFPMYRIVPREQIDTRAWNRCVDAAPNASIFGHSDFLDFATVRWKGLVRGNYEAVFPLAESSKFGIPYLYRPPGLARVDVFSPTLTAAEEMKFVLEMIQRRYLFADIVVAGDVPPAVTPTKTQTAPVLSQYLTIETDDFQTLFEEKFSGSCRRNIARKASDKPLEVVRDILPQRFLNFATTSVAARKIPKFDRQIPAMEKFVAGALKTGLGSLWGAGLGDEILSIALITYYRDTAYLNFIFAGEEGQKQNANYFLVSEIIRAHFPAIRGFDFCGSNIPSIGIFNRRFGAEDVGHTSVRTGVLKSLLKV
ncbi:MAG TPA: hypothetical protein VKY29_01310 [Cryomorphaceae bacterium]|nr:hypothetical protein [Cryomorphaceae bacterium]